MPLRVGLFTEKYAPEIGGLARHSQRVAGLLSRYGIEVVVIAPTSRLPAGEQNVESGDRITVITFGTHKHSGDTMQEWHDIALASRRKYGLEVFHALHASYAAYVAVYSGRYCGIASVVSTRGSDMDSALVDPRRMPLVNWAMEKAGAVTTPSSELGKKVHTLIGERPVYLVPPSVDTDLFRRHTDRAEAKRAAGLAGAKVMGFVGEAKKRKGLVTLLKAFGTAAHADPSVRLHLVGAVKREDAQLIEVFMKANPAVSRNVSLVKWADENVLARQLNLMDVAVVPALRTAGPVPALEAMACEVPVIVSDVPGAREFVRNDDTGFTVTPKDDAALAAAATRVFRDEALAERIGKAARSFVLANATPEREREGLLHAYERAQGKGEKGKTVKFELVPGAR